MINKNLKIALFSFAALFVLSIIYFIFAFIFKLPPFNNEDFGSPPPVPVAPCLRINYAYVNPRVPCVCWCRHQYRDQFNMQLDDCQQWATVTSMPAARFSPLRQEYTPLDQCINQCVRNQKNLC